MLSFLGIGAQKAGTSWMYEHLVRHPDVAFPVGKEIHFWNLLYPDGHPIDRYELAFEAAPGKICGEITPNYSILPEQTVKVIAQRFPHLRLIMLLRNPVERAWSAALMDMIKAGLTYDDTKDQWFIDYFHSPEPFALGDYASSIRLWSSLFATGSMRILFMEELQSDPVNFIRTVATHIGADPSFYKDEDAPELGKKVFSVGNMPLREGLIDPLLELYDKPIDDLSALLGRDFAHWKKRPGA